MTATLTSRIAFRTIQPELGERQQAVYDTLRIKGPMTNTEIAHWLSAPINTITPRTHELRDKDMVVEFEKRECRITGRTAISWAVVKDTLF